MPGHWGQYWTVEAPGLEMKKKWKGDDERLANDEAGKKGGNRGGMIPLSFWSPYIGKGSSPSHSGISVP